VESPQTKVEFFALFDLKRGVSRYNSGSGSLAIVSKLRGFLPYRAGAAMNTQKLPHSISAFSPFPTFS
jgi:hypothetical protein